MADRLQLGITPGIKNPKKFAVAMLAADGTVVSGLQDAQAEALLACNQGEDLRAVLDRALGAAVLASAQAGYAGGSRLVRRGVTV